MALRRFHPASQRVKAIIDSGELGKVKSIVAEFAVPSLLSPLFFVKDDIRYSYDLGGGCTMDMGGKLTHIPLIPPSRVALSGPLR